MSNPDLRILRSQLEEAIGKDPAAIRAFEALFKQVDLASPSGMMGEFGNTTAPSGWLACDGTSYLRSDYPGLFSAIGIVWGSVDDTHFNVPDLRGAFVRGTGIHGVERMGDGGLFAGPAIGVFEDDQLQNHEHRVGHASATSSTFGGYRSANSSGGVDRDTVSMQDGTGTVREGDETRPFAAGVLYCIKT